MSEVDALQAALKGEHAAMYGIGVAGGKLKGAQFVAATRAYEQHRRNRDKLTNLLHAAGETPAAAEPAYDLPIAVTSPATAAALILRIETRLAAVYAELVEAAGEPAVRTLAIQGLLSTAAAQLPWGGRPSPFPGRL